MILSIGERRDALAAIPIHLIVALDVLDNLPGLGKPRGSQVTGDRVEIDVRTPPPGGGADRAPDALAEAVMPGGVEAGPAALDAPDHVRIDVPVLGDLNRAWIGESDRLREILAESPAIVPILGDDDAD